MTDPSGHPGVPAVDPFGPIFLSYSHTGGEIAEDLKLRLWAVGVPVWQDVDRMLVGSPESRVEQAFRDGVSGVAACLTPDANVSGWMTHELREMSGLLGDERFIPGMVNATVDPDTGDDSKPDDRAFDAVLGNSANEYRSALRLPYVTGEQRLATVDAFARRRIEVLAAATDPALPFTIDVQSRLGVAAGPDQAWLRPRLLPAERSVAPTDDAVGLFADALNQFPYLVAASGRKHVVVSGGLQLGLAVALGAVLNNRLVAPPRTRFEVDFHGETWADRPLSELGELPELQLTSTERVDRSAGADGRDLVVVDLGMRHTDGEHWRAHFERDDLDYGRLWEVTAAGDGSADDSARRPIRADHGAGFARAIDQTIRSNVPRNFDLIFIGPFPLAVLFGRHLNTVTTRILEYEGTDGTYRPVLEVTPGAGRRPVTALPNT